MHANVLEDARRKDRLDDIKRGPGGIREIEFLAQCFQLLRGGRDTGLQTPSLDRALAEIETLGLLDHEAVEGLRNDYVFLRFLENRIQALRDQQTHRLPGGEDRARIARAMYEDGVAALDRRLERTRNRVSERFRGIFPSRSGPASDTRWAARWRSLRSTRQDSGQQAAAEGTGPLAIFVRRLHRLALSQRAHQRLDRLMPGLLERLDRGALTDRTVNRVLDLVLAVCRRSAYLVLLVQQPRALDRMLELFERSEWIADKVIRFPALLDELIDPALGRYVPSPRDLARSVARILEAASGTEAVLANLNYLKSRWANSRAAWTASRLAPRCQNWPAPCSAASSMSPAGRSPRGTEASRRPGGHQGLSIIGYGSLGARELGYGSDLDLVFLFETGEEASNGARPLPPERYYARLAQRVLSFLTVMTPSGRLYEVDTRLRPNGRAGSLVSSIGAFSDYQLKEAWTWELQALTRARQVAGSPRVAALFNRVRQEALCRPRDESALARELVKMRHRMMREHGADDSPDQAPKHQPGGLVDIEFLAQFGVLTNARIYPRVIQATGTLPQLQELESIGWLSQQEQSVLSDTMRRLRNDRMLRVLLPGADERPVDTGAAARIFRDRLGDHVSSQGSASE
jgi:glutamate-ammonia-ligase adenylyltransferase